MADPVSGVDVVLDLVEGSDSTARRPPHLAGAERVAANRDRLAPLLADVDVCLITSGCAGLGPGLAGAVANVAAETDASPMTIPTVSAEPLAQERAALDWLTETAGPTAPVAHARARDLQGCPPSAVERLADDHVSELVTALHAVLTERLAVSLDYGAFYDAVEAGGVAVPWVGTVPPGTTRTGLERWLTPLWQPPASGTARNWLGVAITPMDVTLSAFETTAIALGAVFGPEREARGRQLACLTDPGFVDEQRLLVLQFAEPSAPDATS
jgi:hypothetical protein